MPSSDQKPTTRFPSLSSVAGRVRSATRLDAEQRYAIRDALARARHWAQDRVPTALMLVAVLATAEVGDRAMADGRDPASAQWLAAWEAGAEESAYLRTLLVGARPVIETKSGAATIGQALKDAVGLGRDEGEEHKADPVTPTR